MEIFKETNFEGESLRIDGPSEHPNLRFGDDDWGDQIRSLRIGPTAFVLAYKDKDFKDTMHAFGPGDSIADLRELEFANEIDSIRVIDSVKILDRSPETLSEQPSAVPTKHTGAKHFGRRGKKRRG